MKPAEIGIGQQLAAQLLRHPTLALDRQLRHVTEIAVLLPAEIGTPIGALAAHLRDTGFDAAVEEYKATFTAEVCPLWLSHPADSAFTLAYQQAGFRLAEHDRADYLPAVLEFAAARVAADDFRGQELLTEYRSAMDGIADRLRDRGSPYVLALDAVHATLPRVPAA